MKKITTKRLCIISITASLYALITILFSPISYGIIQFRPSEALTLLPLLFPETIIGLFLGCLISNIFSPVMIFDVIVGSLSTLVAGILTKYCKNVFLGGIPPIIINAITIPLVWYFFGGESAYFIFFLSILLSQTVSVYLLGVPLYYAINHWKNNSNIFI